MMSDDSKEFEFNIKSNKKYEKSFNKEFKIKKTSLFKEFIQKKGGIMKKPSPISEEVDSLDLKPSKKK